MMLLTGRCASIMASASVEAGAIAGFFFHDRDSKIPRAKLSCFRGVRTQSGERAHRGWRP